MTDDQNQAAASDTPVDKELAERVVELYGHVDEVFADDNTLRRKTRDVLRKHMMVDEELDEEVRKRIKNLEEGTQTWDIEYGKGQTTGTLAAGLFPGLSAEEAREKRRGFGLAPDPRHPSRGLRNGRGHLLVQRRRKGAKRV